MNGTLRGIINGIGVLVNNLIGGSISNDAFIDYVKDKDILDMLAQVESKRITLNAPLQKKLDEITAKLNAYDLGTMSPDLRNFAKQLNKATSSKASAIRHRMDVNNAQADVASSYLNQALATNTVPDRMVDSSIIQAARKSFNDFNNYENKMLEGEDV